MRSLARTTKRIKTTQPLEIQTTMRNKYHKEKARHRGVSELTNQNTEYREAPAHSSIHSPPSPPPRPANVHENYEVQFQKPAKFVMLISVICRRSGTNRHTMLSMGMYKLTDSL